MDRQSWQEERIQKAATDWRIFREVLRPKKQWGDHFYTTCEAVDPTQAVENHFRGVFVSPDQEGLDEDIQAMIDPLMDREGSPLTLEEVKAAVCAGKPGKSIGPDAVPVELLQALVQDPGGLQGLTSFYQSVYASANIPSDWSRSVLSLLPKTNLPAAASDLRPIALSSHIGKTFSKILLARAGHCLKARHPQQLASPGRQPADMIYAARFVSSLCREWRTKGIMAKLDLRRAFDSVDRRALSRKILEWMQHDHPREAACFLALMKQNQLTIALPWGEQVDITSGVGVRQGSVESPGLFSKLIDDILGQVCEAHTPRLFPDMTCNTVAFMDDVLTWHPEGDSLGIFLRLLLPALRAFGLTLQPAKCQLMLMAGAVDPGIVLDGVRMVPLREDEPLFVMHLPITPLISDLDAAVCLLDRARGKFHSLLPVLSAGTSLAARLQLLDTVVLATFKWVVGVLFPSNKVQQTVNYMQCRCVRSMMGIKRRSGELWVQYEQRSLRLARLMIWKHRGLRWGDIALQMYWRYSGHRARQDDGSVTAELTHFRTLQWWSREQQRSGGRRHGRHFPALMSAERQLAAAAGDENWRDVARDRALWKQKEGVWTRRMAVPWSSMRQPALGM